MKDQRLAARLDALTRRGRAGLAWEVLRRDPLYQRGYDATAAHAAAIHAAGERDAQSFADSWGLHFRRESSA